MNQPPPGLGGPPGLPGGGIPGQGQNQNPMHNPNYNHNQGHGNGNGYGQMNGQMNSNNANAGMGGMPPGLNVPPGMGMGMSSGGSSPGPPPGLSVSPNPSGGVSPGQQHQQQQQQQQHQQQPQNQNQGQTSGQGSTFGSPVHGFVQPQLYPQPSLGPPLAQTSHHQQYQHQPGGTINITGNNSSGSVSTIVKAQIVFLLSTLTEDAWERNVSEIRTLISQNAPEMYHHFLRRLIVNAAPVLQGLQSQAAGMQQQQQQQQGMVAGDRPLGGNLSVPQNGPGVLAWRVLVSEGVRASRDSNLAPHFAATLLVPVAPSTQPAINLNLLQLDPMQLFSFACNVLASPALIPSVAMHDRACAIVRTYFENVVNNLRQPGSSLFGSGTDDLSPPEARIFILAVYPRIPEEGGPNIVDPTQAQLNALPQLPLDSRQRERFLQALVVKFSSPVVIIQALASISPGAPPNHARAIPLSDVLFEVGDAWTSDAGIVWSIVCRWWAAIINNREEGSREIETALTETFTGLIRGVEEGRSVDVQGVVRGLAMIPNVDWADVVKEFDQPNTVLTKPAAQEFLFGLLTLTPTGPRSAMQGLFSSESRWTHTLSLLHVLNNLLTVSSDRFPISSIPSATRLVVEEDFGDLSSPVQALAQGVLGSTWNIKELTDILAEVTKRLQSQDVQDKELVETAWEMVLEKGMKSASDLVVIGFSMVERPWSEAHSSIVASLLAMFIKGQPTSQLVMSVLGRIQPDMIVDALHKNYEENELNVNRVVECGQDAQVLDKLLSSPSLPLALDVAAVASKRDLVDLESWVVDGIEKHGADFVHAALDFLDRKVNAESSGPETQADTVPLTPPVYATFFRALRNSDILNADDIGHFKEIRNMCLQIHPRLMNLNPEANTEPGLAVVAFPPEVDAQVDDFYQRMYAEEISLDHVIEVFQRLKKSDSRQDRQLFACMLHTLFDEYKFVQTYPPRELAMTGLLFGSIIQYHLVESTPLHVAVRYVLDALQSPPDSTMFSFGKNALNIFQSRLPEFPLMCRALLEIPHLHESNPVLMSIIRTALTERGMDGDEGGSRPGSPDRVIFPGLQVVELDQEEPDNELTLPEERTSDQILFIVNNLAPTNFEEKANDLKRLIVTRYSRWFAEYLVNARISVEPNNHGLYMQLIETLSLAILEKHVLWETYRKSAQLLNSEKTLDNSQDKVVLKNIASWLGKLTVARDLPVKHRQLSLKDVLVQGYDEKRLQVAIPFVCKIMEQCARSKVFHPPNPWLMAVMGLLTELYQFAELKLNLKFEIEVLCKTLEVDLGSIQPSDILRKRTPPVPPTQPARLAQELDRITMPAAGGYMGAGGVPSQAGPGEAAQQAVQDAFLRRIDELIAQLPSQLLFNPAYPMFQSTTALKRIVHLSIDRALREIINPVVERSVTIAGISSRDLLMKDFGMESDDAKLRQAAHLMVSKLAGSLALVTCKEPLRTSMLNNIRTMMLQSGFTEDTLPEQAIIGTVSDNLDVACNIIKTAAQEKAVKDIDVNLTPAYATRRKHREAGQIFMDPTSFSNIVSRSALPETLRLVPHGLQNIQLRVYEDFGDQSRFAASVSHHEAEYGQSAEVSGMQSTSAAETMRNGARGSDSPSIPLGEVVESSIMTTKLTVAQSLEKFQELVMELDKLLSRADVDSLAQLPLHHDVKMIIRQIPVIATQSAYTDQTALAFSQKIVQLLYKSASNLGREVWVSILQRLCDLFTKVAKEVMQWLIYAEDIRKFNVPVTVTLVRAGLIVVSEFDAQLSKMIYREFSQSVVDFAAQLISEAVVGSAPCASRSQFSSSIEALGRAAANRRGTPSVEHLLEDLQNKAQYSAEPSEGSDRGDGSPKVIRTQGPPGSQSIDPDLRATLSIYFLEWVRLFTSPLPVETTFVPFVNRLQKQGILKGEEISSAFYRNSIALAIDMYSKHKASGSPQMFHGVDALSRLIALLLKNYSDTHGVSSDSAKTLYFAKIITIAALSLVRDHEELGANFEQRPYFRFFSSLLCDLQIIQSSFPEAYYGCLQTFANHLGSIQPTIAPAFSYSWISLISHRHFMPRLLQGNNKEGWTDFYRVLMALFKFLNPFLEAASFHQASRILFKGALRILLVILKDFPEFLVEHYIGLCAAIPAHCIQLRNVVLCAFPRGVTLRLDVNSLSEVPPLPEFNQVPDIRTDYVRFLEDAQIRQAVDRYIADETPNPAALVPELRNRIAISVAESDGSPGVKYNLTLLYSLSLYLGSSAVNRSIERNGRVTFDPQGPEVGLLTSLIASLDGEGQHHFINSIVNQLRYPNAHTLFFMLYILHLFSTAPKNGDVPERITRVLLERVLAQRPHPWGLTMAFGELLHNEKLGFWEFPWVRAEPELLAIFQRCYGSGHL